MASLTKTAGKKTTTGNKAHCVRLQRGWLTMSRLAVNRLFLCTNSIPWLLHSLFRATGGHGRLPWLPVSGVSLDSARARETISLNRFGSKYCSPGCLITRPMYGSLCSRSMWFFGLVVYPASTSALSLLNAAMIRYSSGAFAIKNNMLSEVIIHWIHKLKKLRNAIVIGRGRKNFVYFVLAFASTYAEGPSRRVPGASLFTSLEYPWS